MSRLSSPVQFVFSTVTLFALIVFFVILRISAQPWLGISLTAIEGEQGLWVTEVAANSPAAGKLQPGQQILQLQGIEISITLDESLLQAPDSFPGYATLNHYLAQQQIASSLLAQPTVTLQLADGETVKLTPLANHPISAIPLVFFAYLLAGFLCMSIGLLLWLYRPQLYVTRLIMAAGFGSLLYFITVVLQYRELALPANWLELTNSIGLLGVNVFAWGQVAIFMVYPIRIWSNKAVIATLCFMLLAWLNSSLQWFVTPLHAYMLQFLLIALLFYYLLYRQWQATQTKPAERAVIRLFILMMVIPTAFVILLWMLPIMLGLETLISHTLVRFIFVPVAIGWALAVFRYRLFEVEQWWFRSVLWMTSGILVLIFDVVFVYLIGLEAVSALGIALIIAGFLYFPLRQILLSRLFPSGVSTLDQSLPILVDNLQTAASDKDLQNAWQEIIRNRFNPAYIKKSNHPHAEAKLYEEGLILHIPDVLEQHGYEVSGKNKGNGLFNKNDINTISSLLILTRTVLQATRSREETLLQERTRIMRDLHDSLGAKLLAMAQRWRGSESEEDAREALQTLRDTVHLSASNQPVALDELLGEWRMETRERLEIADVQLHWSGLLAKETIYLSSSKNLLLRSFLREGISNALKHAHPQNIYIQISRNKHNLLTTIRNDGAFTMPENWKLGFGLTHLRDRLIRAGGDLQITHSPASIETPRLVTLNALIDLGNFQEKEGKEN